MVFLLASVPDVVRKQPSAMSSLLQREISRRSIGPITADGAATTAADS